MHQSTEANYITPGKSLVTFLKILLFLHDETIGFFLE
jgi:hypothetical protein